MEWRALVRIPHGRAFRKCTEKCLQHRCCTNRPGRCGVEEDTVQREPLLFVQRLRALWAGR